MLLVADVHGAFGPLASAVSSGEPVAILGDLVNLIDYRTSSGILADIVGREVVAAMVALRTVDPEASRRAWREAEAELGLDLPTAIADHVAASYREMAATLTGIAMDVEVIHGNVDHPELLRDHLPRGMRWAHGSTRMVDGERFGFAGGGVPRIGTPGEVDDDEMARTLERLGPVDVLCTHVPPALDMLAHDVIGGPGKGSEPVRDYLERYRPRRHYYGDVHQPRAVSMRVGSTECVNVGYFRATHRPVRHAPPG